MTEDELNASAKPEDMCEYALQFNHHCPLSYCYTKDLSQE